MTYYDLKTQVKSVSYCKYFLSVCESPFYFLDGVFEIF